MPLATASCSFDTHPGMGGGPMIPTPAVMSVNPVRKKNKIITQLFFIRKKRCFGGREEESQNFFSKVGGRGSIH